VPGASFCMTWSCRLELASLYRSLNEWVDGILWIASSDWGFMIKHLNIYYLS
jgi:hypothetical protein